jgi:hypothetical protein
MRDPAHRVAKSTVNSHAIRQPPGGDEDSVRSLMAHVGRADFRADGRTSEQNRQCVAVSVSKWKDVEAPRCPKASIVLLEVPDDGAIALCGGHFDKHRRGRDVPLWPGLWSLGNLG